MKLYHLLFEAEESLEEIAATVSDAHANKLALANLSKGRHTASFVLYSPDKMLAAIEENKQAHNFEAYVDAIHGKISATILNNQVGEIMTSSAEKGFGPLMYEILMSANPKIWFMSDRNSVSTSARRVWKEFFKRDDVEKRPARFPLETYEDDESLSALGYEYRLKRPIDFSVLVETHQTFKNSLPPEVKQVFEDSILHHAGKKFFMRKYQ